ncbi:winged helix DNA-binding domain-containing protein [Pseudonocardia sp. WMMC193]|uniref:winged helix DNA-binding domain-containing protein n=1 Tax=Pseudonocardia sp. WMMC193 TaxID=2911965 RepID=UPI001F359F3C|nr:winged helix DNA-binding domain-containing protein [Pseudonocardia sp. WMMC193]MCF7550248.1 winged helix DNA-binding domain-containing protein [Pseudonocardia sp. WMMC193]
MRALSPEAQRTALLGRQLLLERAPLDPVRAVEKVGGLQTQYSPSGYVGLWSRLAAFSRDDLTEALHRGRIVQGWMMRCTIHMVSAADWAPLTEAVRQARRALWLRTVPAARELDMPAVAATVADLLADGPRKQAEITARLVADGFPTLAWQGVQLWLDLVRIPPAGTWDSPRAHVYELASRWLRARSVTAPQELLVRRYLGGFGPATPQDVARYAGWSITDTRAVLARMSLREFADGLVDLPRAPLPAPDTPAPVRFLGPWDAVLLLGHATRTGILPAEHRDKVFHVRMPQSTPTFLVDGRVAGTWTHVDGAVRVTPFAPLSPAARDEVDAEAARLAAFYAVGRG